MIGATTTQYSTTEIHRPTPKLTARCNTLRPLLDYDQPDAVHCSVETLGNFSLHHLSIQHDLDADPKRDADSTKTIVVDHITSGGCEASCINFQLMLSGQRRVPQKGTRVQHQCIIDFPMSKGLPPLPRVPPLAGLICLFNRSRFLQFDMGKRLRRTARSPGPLLLTYVACGRASSGLLIRGSPLELLVFRRLRSTRIFCSHDWVTHRVDTMCIL